MFQVPLNNLSPEQICGTDYLYLFQTFAFSSPPLPQPSLSLPVVMESMQLTFFGTTGYAADISENLYQLLQL